MSVTVTDRPQTLKINLNYASCGFETAHSGEFMKFFPILLLSLSLASCANWETTKKTRPAKHPQVAQESFKKWKQFRNVANESGARDFRIERYSVSKNGYAIGWGVKGEKLDFEALDRMSEEEIDNFIDTAKVVNYVVDLQTNKILAELADEDGRVSFTIGNRRVGNRNSLSIQDFKVQGPTSYDEESFLVVQDSKWGNTVSNLIVVKRENEVKVLHNIDNGKFDLALQQQILKELKKKKAELDFFNRAVVSTGESQETYFKTTEATKIRLVAEIPKDPNNKNLILDLVIKTTIEDGAFKIDILAIDTKFVKY